MLRIDIDKLESHLDRIQATLKKSLIGASIWDSKSGLEIVSYNPKPKAAAELTLFTQSLKATLAEIGFHPLNRYFLLDLAGDHMVVVILHGDDLMEGLLLDASKVNMGVLFSIAIPYALEDVREAREQSGEHAVSNQASDAEFAEKSDPSAAADNSVIDMDKLKPVDKALLIRRELDGSLSESDKGAAIPDNVRHLSFEQTKTDAISDEAIARLIEETGATAEAAKQAIDSKPVLSLHSKEASKDIASDPQNAEAKIQSANDKADTSHRQDQQAKQGGGSVVKPTASADAGDVISASDDHLEEIFDHDNGLIIKEDTDRGRVSESATDEDADILSDTGSAENQAKEPPQVREAPTVLELPDNLDQTSIRVDDPEDELGKLADTQLEAQQTEELEINDTVSDESLALDNEEDALSEVIETSLDGDYQADEALVTDAETMFIDDADLDAIDKVADELGLSFDDEDMVVDDDGAMSALPPFGDTSADVIAESVESAEEIDVVEVSEASVIEEEIEQPLQQDSGAKQSSSAASHKPNKGGKYLAEARNFTAHADEERPPLDFDNSQYFKLYKWPNVSAYDDKMDLSVMCSKLMRGYYDLPTILSWGVSESHVKEILQNTYQDGVLSVVNEKPSAIEKPEKSTAENQSHTTEPSSSTKAGEKAQSSQPHKQADKATAPSVAPEEKPPSPNADAAAEKAKPEKAAEKPKPEEPPEEEITMVIIDDEELSQQA